MTNPSNNPNNPNNPKKAPIQIEVSPNLRAVYANLALITHTPNEIFIDFAQQLPGLKKIPIQTRVVMSPTHAKLLLRALTENLDRYEAQHGPIDVPPSLADQLFGNVRRGSATDEEEQDDTE